MAARQGTMTPIDPGMIQRLVTGVRYALTGVRPDSWFGPGQPLQPVAQEQARGRAYDFSVNTNLRITPRAEEAISFPQMRALADGFDFLRLVIETRKDQVCSLRWTIKPKDDKAEPDSRCARITEFLTMPDQEHNWPTWLRMLLEEMLVLDAATVYPRLTRGGDIYALELIDGATIKRVIDETGRTPAAPDPAYQQIIKGIPAVNYSRDELIYMPRNVRANRVYGFSPVEQIIVTVNIAIRRQISQLEYFTAGNIPEAMIGVPDTWNPDQIRQFQDYWDEMLEGNTAARRKAKFIPGGMDIHETRPNLLKDQFDEWLIRLICYAFAVNPNNMLSQINRATAEVNKASADEEGLTPTLLWVKGLMDMILARWFRCPDLHFEFDLKREIDPAVQATIHEAYIRSKVLTPDEVRAELGFEPLTDEQREQLAPAPVDQLSDGKQMGNNKQGSDAKKGALPDIHINVQPPEVLVDVGATTINAHFDDGRQTVTAGGAGERN